MRCLCPGRGLYRVLEIDTIGLKSKVQVVSGQLLRQWVGMLVHCYLLAQVAGLCPQSAPGLSRPDLLASFLVRNPTNMLGESPDMLAGLRAQNPP